MYTALFKSRVEKGLISFGTFSVSCSSFEGHSLSVCESLANGCPVVSYDYKYGPQDGIANGAAFGTLPNTVSTPENVSLFRIGVYVFCDN